jgi:hypothetical protein
LIPQSVRTCFQERSSVPRAYSGRPSRP